MFRSISRRDQKQKLNIGILFYNGALILFWISKPEFSETRLAGCMYKTQSTITGISAASLILLLGRCKHTTLVPNVRGYGLQHASRKPPNTCSRQCFSALYLVKARAQRAWHSAVFCTSGPANRQSRNSVHKFQHKLNETFSNEVPYTAYLIPSLLPVGQSMFWRSV